MIKLYHAYKCEFTGRASESADEVRQWEIDAATKIVAASKNVGELRAALKADDESLWRAIRYLDQNKHHIAAPLPEPKAQTVIVSTPIVAVKGGLISPEIISGSVVSRGARDA